MRPVVVVVVHHGRTVGFIDCSESPEKIFCFNELYAAWKTLACFTSRFHINLISRLILMDRTASLTVQ